MNFDLFEPEVSINSGNQPKLLAFLNSQLRTIGALLRAAALIARAIPEAIIRRIRDITWNLNNRNRDASLSVLGPERNTYADGRTRGTDALFVAAPAVLTAWPFRKCETTGFSEFSGLRNVAAVVGVVEPHSGACTRVGFAAKVFDEDVGVWVDGRARCAGCVRAQLEFAVAMVGAVDVGTVADGCVFCVAVALSSLCGKGVAFAWIPVLV